MSKVGAQTGVAPMAGAPMVGTPMVGTRMAGTTAVGPMMEPIMGPMVALEPMMALGPMMALVIHNLQWKMPRSL